MNSVKKSQVFIIGCKRIVWYPLSIINIFILFFDSSEKKTRSLENTFLWTIEVLIFFCESLNSHSVKITIIFFIQDSIVRKATVDIDHILILFLDLDQANTIESKDKKYIKIVFRVMNVVTQIAIDCTLFQKSLWYNVHAKTF